MIIGLFVYLVMRAMGEMLLPNLNFKTFADFAGAYLKPRAAFFLGWSYWLSWSVAVIGDAVVVGGFFQYWFPHLPAWMSAWSSALPGQSPPTALICMPGSIISGVRIVA